MEEDFTEMEIDEWELLLYNKNSDTTVKELVFPSQSMEEEEVLSLRSSIIEQQDLTPIQPTSFQATEFESDDEVVEGLWSLISATSFEWFSHLLIYSGIYYVGLSNRRSCRR